MTIKYIIVHCSGTRADRDYTLEQLRRDHVKGNGWRDIGYNFYIRKDGTLHRCRPLSITGAHCLGYNDCSIGVCYEGGLDIKGEPCDTRTTPQRVVLRSVLTALKHVYPNAKICGHRDFAAKACPCFNAAGEYSDL